MTIPVKVERTNGGFTASVLVSPSLRASGGTRESALTALRSSLFDPKQDELVMLDVPATTPSEEYSAEELEVLREQTAEAYRFRDEAKAREFPE